MRKPKLFWIKARYNPQLGTYYVPMGQLSRREAMRHEITKYGENIMLSYETEADYQAKLKELQQTGNARNRA